MPVRYKNGSIAKTRYVRARTLHLRALRRLVGQGGTVLVADERVADRFTAPGDDIERFMYGFSVLHCLPVSREGQPSAATGAVMREEIMRRYAGEAGFREVEVLPIAQGLAELGFQIIGTRGAAAYLRAHGVDCSVVFKVNEGRPSLADEIVNRKISMVINTPHGRESFFDDKAVRRAAMMAGVPCITTITGAAAALEAIRALKTEGLDVRALQDYYAAVAASQ